MTDQVTAAYTLVGVCEKTKKVIDLMNSFDENLTLKQVLTVLKDQKRQLEKVINGKLELSAVEDNISRGIITNKYGENIL